MKLGHIATKSIKEKFNGAFVSNCFDYIYYL